MRSLIAAGLGLLGLLAPLAEHDARANTIVTDINNQGSVVGITDWKNGDALEEARAFIWKHGMLTRLPMLSGAIGSDAVAMNDNGQVAGYALGDEPSHYLVAILWTEGAAVDLMPGTVAAEALAINNRAQIAVVSYDNSHAFLWSDGVLIDLGLCDTEGFSLTSTPNYYGLAVSDRGDVIGDIAGKSFFWSRGQRTELSFRATALNNRGQVIGEHFVWEAGELTDLGSLGGGNTLAQAINDRGQVAGTSYTGTGERHLFLWERGQMQDLGTLFNSYLNVAGLNNRGGVVAAQSLDRVGFWRDGGRSEGVEITATLPNVNNYPCCGNFPQAGINDPGQIFANRFYGGNSFDSYIWEGDEWTHIEDSQPLSTAAAPPRSAGIDRQELRIASHIEGHWVSFEVHGNGAAPYAASIFDVQGRLVRRWDRSAGLGSRWAWDGRGSDGAGVPSGIYFLRVDSHGRQSTTRILLTR